MQPTYPALSPWRELSLARGWCCMETGVMLIFARIVARLHPAPIHPNPNSTPKYTPLPDLWFLTAKFKFLFVCNDHWLYVVQLLCVFCFWITLFWFMWMWAMLQQAHSWRSTECTRLAYASFSTSRGWSRFRGINLIETRPCKYLTISSSCLWQSCYVYSL
jgi:hypothetical protein